MKASLRITAASYLIFFVSFLNAFPIYHARAEFAEGSSMSSDNFKVLDAQHGSFGGVSSSSSGNYILLGSMGDVAIGSSSITNFKLNSGFLYYPKVVAPILNTATAGTTQVALAWTAASAFQGLSIGGYNVCTSSGGGAYSCTSVGNTTASTRTSLTAGTVYTFKIEAYDAFSNVIATSNELSATPTAPAAAGGGGGGGGGGVYIPPASGDTGKIIINGTSYPQSTITIFRGGVVAASIKAGANAKFQAELGSVPVGSSTISLNSQDPNGRKSLTISFVVNVSKDTTITLSDVLLPPTIDISATQLARGDTLRIFGQAQPISEVSVHVFSDEIINKVVADSDGAYTLSFNTKPLADDSHTTKSRAVLSEVVSPFSQVLQFLLGKGGTSSKTADTNKDTKINIIDFSILLYWWNTGSAQGLGIADINKDNKVNIIDFSILLFQWTG